MLYFYSRLGRDRVGGRIRCHALAEHLGMVEQLPSSYTMGDVVFFKTPNVIELRKAKTQGAVTVYDVCDVWFRQMSRTSIENMLSECHLITTSTRELATIVKSNFRKPLVVLPSVLDWDGTTVKENYLVSGKKTAVWTSYPHQIANLKYVYHSLIGQGFGVKVVSGPRDRFFKYFYKESDIQFVEWSEKTVDAEIALADFMVIPLRDSLANSVREPHRMLKAWAIGLPCYASAVPSYIRFCNENNISHECLVDNWEDISGDLEWHPKLREIASCYRADKLAAKWADAFTFAKEEFASTFTKWW